MTELSVNRHGLFTSSGDVLMVRGEVWSETAIDDLVSGTPSDGDAVAALLEHAATATPSRPSKKWLRTASGIVDGADADATVTLLQRWFSLVSQSHTAGSLDTIPEPNAIMLKGLLWLSQFLPGDSELTRQITAVALSCFKKIPGLGPRATKVGNAAVYALSQIGSADAVGQLAILKTRIKFASAQKEIEKAFNAAAESLGLPRDQIEEISVPNYGLKVDGQSQTQLGDYTATISITDSTAQLSWHDSKGKQLKSVPAKVRSEFKDDLKELRQIVKDVQSMLAAQRDRVDSLFLLQKNWAFKEWNERYLQHPLINTIASRLIWCVDETPALFINGTAIDVEGTSIEHGQTAEVTLWHPVGRAVADVVSWRRRLEVLEVTQPFKQAHREVYLLTDAERRTEVYSNRFAAHVLRQHQFHALCAARGWKNKLRLMVDDAIPPAVKILPQWGLRAEFWIEGIGDDYGTDTNEAGVFLRVATDQVRFHRIEAIENLAHACGGGYGRWSGDPILEGDQEPVPLEEIPPLVFSEIMRDVDLFVGVSSVGNDPTWQDGGPDGHFRDYWHSYSFGELTGTAGTRKQVLERLVPRLKIAERCQLSDRFLVVRGERRTYKIHLGSGNILMEPNDQYLCIVPDAKARLKQDDLFLPFEGDNMLSIILSKAFLLAEDTKIKDPTITRQIEMR